MVPRAAATKLGGGDWHYQIVPRTAAAKLGDRNAGGSVDWNRAMALLVAIAATTCEHRHCTEKLGLSLL